MDDTSVTPIGAWPQAISSVAVTPLITADWMSDTTFNLGSPEAPYMAFEVPTSYREGNPAPLKVSQTATFSSTTGTEIDVDLGVNFGVVSTGVSVALTYTTTDVYTTEPTLSCEFYDPSTTQTAVFYYTYDGGSTALADVIHVWLAGYCPVNDKEC